MRIEDLAISRYPPHPVVQDYDYNQGPVSGCRGLDDKDAWVQDECPSALGARGDLPSTNPSDAVAGEFHKLTTWKRELFMSRGLSALQGLVQPVEYASEI